MAAIAGIPAIRTKASAEEQRVLWLEVGVALMYGKVKENREKGQKFSEWVQEMFPGLGINDAADAIWLSENFTLAVKNVEAGISHPKNIRQAYREQEVVAAPTPDLTLTAPDRLTASIEQVGPQAKTINKLARMADRGIGQEKLTAQKYLDKKAKVFP